MFRDFQQHPPVPKECAVANSRVSTRAQARRSAARRCQRLCIRRAGLHVEWLLCAVVVTSDSTTMPTASPPCWSAGASIATRGIYALTAERAFVEVSVTECETPRLLMLDAQRPHIRKQEMRGWLSPRRP